MWRINIAGEHGKMTANRPRHATFHVGCLVVRDELSVPACVWHQPHILPHLTHHWPTVVNRCQRRTTACMCARWESRACRGLGSISGALSLNLVLMWPMRLLWPRLPCPHYTQPSGALQLYLHLSPSCTLLSKNLHVHAHFHFHTIYLHYPAKSKNNASVVLFMFIYPLRLVGNMYVIFSGKSVCHTFAQWSICPAWKHFDSTVHI